MPSTLQADGSAAAETIASEGRRPAGKPYPIAGAGYPLLIAVLVAGLVLAIAAAIAIGTVGGAGCGTIRTIALSTRGGGSKLCGGTRNTFSIA